MSSSTPPAAGRSKRLPRMLCRLAAVLLCSVHASAQSSAPASADALYRSGAGLLSRGLHDMAARDFDRFLSQFPDDAQAPLARYGLAVCRFQAGEFEKAQTELEKIKLDADFAYGAEVGAMLGQCRLARKQPGPAIAALARVIKEFPTHELADDCASMLAEALLAESRNEDAIRLCDQFDRRWADSPLRERVAFVRSAAHFARGEYSVAAGRFESYLEDFPAGSQLDRALLLAGRARDRAGDAPRAAGHYAALLKRPPGEFHAEAMLALAELSAAQAKAGDAAELLDRLLAQPGDGPTQAAGRLLRARLHVEAAEFDAAQRLLEPLARGDSPNAPEANYWLAKALLRRGQPSAAAALLQSALDARGDGPLRPEMRFDLAVALARDAKWPQAAEQAEKLLRDHADHSLAADARALLAQALGAQGRHDECAAACRDFLSAQPQHELAPDLAFLLAESEYLGKRIDRSLDSYQSYLSQWPTHAQAPRARYRMAMGFYQLEKFEPAAARLQEIVRDRNPDDATRPAWLALADIHVLRGDWKQAEPLVRAYLSADQPPAAADDAWFKLGLALLRQGRPKDAVAAFDSLLTGFPASETRLHAQFERGQALLAMEQPEAARAAFESVLKDGPDSRFAPYANQHLAALAAKRGDHRQAAERFEHAARAGGDSALATDAKLGAAEALLAAGDHARALELLDGLTRENGPRSARRIFAQRAIALSRLDRFADALRAADEAGHATGDPLPPTLARALRHEQAWCLRKLDRPADAAKVYESILADTTETHDTSAMLALAEIEAAADRTSRAAELLREFKAAGDANPSAATPEQREAALYRLGVCEHKLERFPQCADAMELLLKESPKSPLVPSARYFAADAYARGNAAEKAVAHLAWLMENARSDPVYASALLRGGEVLAGLQRWPASEKAMTDYLEKFANSDLAFQARFGLGWARENQGRLEEAMTAYREVVSSHKGPTAARAQFQIGECLIAAKKYEEAVRELLNVDIQFAYPEWSAAALHEAGRALEMMGRVAEARAQFQTVVSKHADTRWAEMSRARLKQLESAGPPGRGSSSR